MSNWKSFVSRMFPNSGMTLLKSYYMKLTFDALPQFLYGRKVFLSLLDVEIIHFYMGSGKEYISSIV